MSDPQGKNRPLSYTTISVSSSFPAANRPIFVRPIADVTRRTKSQSLPVLLSGVQDILRTNELGNTLVHTVSYDITGFLMANLRIPQRVYGYRNRSERERAIHGFLSCKVPSVLFAPSMERGLDLPYDACRTIVVCKVPYPSLADKQISHRLYGTGTSGRLWYTVETIRLLVQMTGRGMRHEDDYCESYILDAQFPQLYRRYRHLFPSWWREALKL